MNEKLYKVGSTVWLVPPEIATPQFEKAVEKLNTTPHGGIIGWTKEEEAAFKRVLSHHATWRPL